MHEDGLGMNSDRLDITCHCGESIEEHHEDAHIFTKPSAPALAINGRLA